ncbi:TetR/AcrR family transcriptional regulator [Nocardia sp. 348MFTsu5.1]|uniref:TetR/AcrR family transcriptional regulator n=1 Tax=Nocardia sp. 348MFTsu5.1 TaxID=1172185 RepID=UPI00048FA2FE|nr:TetR/AcrR family transcriptional regulator [Nocardia sp. 348MFTsu5.1]
MSQVAAGPGRPRLVEQRRRGATARDEILDAAAELFTTRGYSGTSTRMIAEAVGIRQASLYHHFKTKDDILESLLQDTVLAPLEHAVDLIDAEGSALDRLLTLARFDAGQLAGSRWNLGALYLLPELRTDRFAEFRSARSDLARIYARLAGEVLGDESDARRHLPFRLVESVISMRSDEMVGVLGSDSLDELVTALVDSIELILA